MALARPLSPLWQTLLPALNGPVRPVVNLPLLQRLSQPFQLLPTPFAALAIPALSLPKLPSLADIWEGILKAVPKKKTSHRKKRQRFMAGKAIKEITSLNKCSACGRIKRAHILCPYCVNMIKTKIFNMIPWEKREPFGHPRKRLGDRERFAKQIRAQQRADREGEPKLDKLPGGGKWVPK